MNYSELKTKIADWLHRSDLTAQIPDFIAMAESRINRLINSELLEKNAQINTVANSRNVAIPSDFGVPIALWLEEFQPRWKIIYVDSSALIVDESTNGQPTYWTYDANSIAFERKADKIYPLTLQYKSKLSLSDAAPNNDILTNFPDLYIYGSLLDAAPYIRDAQLIGMWQERFDRAVMEINNEESRKKGLATLSTEFARNSTFDVYRGF